MVAIQSLFGLKGLNNETINGQKVIRKSKNKHTCFHKGTAEEPILISQEDADDEKRILESLIKLTKLEDIEEKLGIDLITLFEEMEKPREKYFRNIYLKYKGNTWVLTKEELENVE